MGYSGRTDLPDFHIYTLESTYPSTRPAMPPYTLRFYCVALIENSADAALELNARSLAPDNLLAFQSPDHVSAWVRGKAQRGFIAYFQPEFLPTLARPLADEFPFFRPAAVHALSLDATARPQIRRRFEELHASFQERSPYRTEILRALLLALLYESRGVFEAAQEREQTTPQTARLARRFRALVDKHYLTLQTVKDYARLLDVSPNHLSSAAAATLGQTARDVIAERLALEARLLLRYSELSVADVADHLGFEEPTHFSRFFKRHAGKTPLEFRREFSCES